MDSHSAYRMIRRKLKTIGEAAKDIRRLDCKKDSKGNYRPVHRLYEILVYVSMIDHITQLPSPVKLSIENLIDKKGYKSFKLHNKPGDKDTCSWAVVRLCGKSFELFNNVVIVDRLGNTKRAPDISLCKSDMNCLKRQIMCNVIAIWDCKYHEKMEGIIDSEFLTFKRYMERLLPPAVEKNDDLKKLMPECLSVSGLITNGKPYIEEEREMLRYGFSQTTKLVDDFNTAIQKPHRDKHEKSRIYRERREFDYKHL